MEANDYNLPGSPDGMDEDYVRFTQECIDGMQPGIYLIQEIYGDAWNEHIVKFFSPTQWGKHFKLAVANGRLKRLRLLLEASGNPMLSSDRQLQYEVKGG